MSDVTVHAWFDPVYYGSYLEGLAGALPDARVRFGTEGFPWPKSKCMCFRLESPKPLRVCIHADDRCDLDDRDVLDWCDVYAAVNFDQDKVPACHAHKVLAIQPSFATTVWSLPRSFRHMVANFLKCRHQLQGARERTIHGWKPQTREFIANYWRQYRIRLPERAWHPYAVEDDYVFFNTTIWKGDRQVNDSRARFMRACQSIPGLRFEGGFRPRTYNDVAGYESFTTPRHYPLKEYLVKTAKSVVVFNNPSVKGSHSWRLCEYMALGKAIVSTPLNRPLPVPLQHGQQLHFVPDTVEAIRDAIIHLREHADYRHHLEQQARRYYEQHLRPASVVKGILEFGLRPPAKVTASRAEFASTAGAVQP